MQNVNASLSFAQVAAKFVALDQRVDNVFGSLVQWVSENDVTKENSKDVFKLNEAQYLAKTGRDLQKSGTYKSAKSVVRSALEYAIDLFDANGNARGKSAIEADVKEAKNGTKTEIEKFEQLFGTLSTIADKLTGKDKAAAKAKLEALAAKLK